MMEIDYNLMLDEYIPLYSNDEIVECIVAVNTISMR